MSFFTMLFFQIITFAGWLVDLILQYSQDAFMCCTIIYFFICIKRKVYLYTTIQDHFRRLECLPGKIYMYLISFVAIAMLEHLSDYWALMWVEMLNSVFNCGKKKINLIQKNHKINRKGKMAVILNDKLIAAKLFWGTARHQLPPTYVTALKTHIKIT